VAVNRLDDVSCMIRHSASYYYTPKPAALRLLFSLLLGHLQPVAVTQYLTSLPCEEMLSPTFVRHVRYLPFQHRLAGTFKECVEYFRATAAKHSFIMGIFKYFLHQCLLKLYRVSMLNSPKSLRTSPTSKRFLNFKVSLRQTQFVLTKVKVKLALCLTKHHAMNMYGGVETWLHAFLTSAMDGGEWLASRHGHFIPGKSPRYILDRRLGGPQNRSGRGG